MPESLNGSIVSSHYFLFVVNESKLKLRFLDYFIRTPAFREQVAAQGSTNYAAIRPAHVLGYEIPLPPLAEQRRVVARIEELAAQIHEARTLRHQAAEEAEALFASFLTATFRLIPLAAEKCCQKLPKSLAASSPIVPVMSRDFMAATSRSSRLATSQTRIATSVLFVKH